MKIHLIDSIHIGLLQCVLDNAILSERTSPIVNKWTVGYLLEVTAITIRGIHSPMLSLKIIPFSESCQNFGIWRVIFMRPFKAYQTWEFVLVTYHTNLQYKFTAQFSALLKKSDKKRSWSIYSLPWKQFQHKWVRIKMSRVWRTLTK